MGPVQHRLAAQRVAYVVVLVGLDGGEVHESAQMTRQGDDRRRRAGRQNDQADEGRKRAADPGVLRRNGHPHSHSLGFERPRRPNRSSGAS